jgi:hypothetical protein
MHLDGALLDAQRFADLAVGVPGDEQVQHLALAFGEHQRLLRVHASRSAGYPLDELAE